MYETYFGLERAPFTLSPDPRFLYAAPRTREAFAGVLHGILDRRGFVVLTGESGTGKSTLLRAVLSEISPDRLASSLIVNPTVRSEEFLELAMLDFGMPDIPNSKPKRLARLNDFLIDNHSEGRISVLLIDEAHTLTPELLEEIRLLTNFESSDTKLLQIVLSGHSELDETLERHELRQLKQRIAIRVSLRALQSPNEVGSYMLHRWRKAGATTDLAFLPGAISAIAHYSQGIPRTINALCDNGLLLAYGAGKRAVDRPMVIEIARDMRLLVPPVSKAAAFLPAPPPPAPPPPVAQGALLPHAGDLSLNAPSTQRVPVDEELFAPAAPALTPPVRPLVPGNRPILVRETSVGGGSSSSAMANAASASSPAPQPPLASVLEDDDDQHAAPAAGGSSGAVRNGSVIGQWASRFRKDSSK